MQRGGTQGLISKVRSFYRRDREPTAEGFYSKSKSLERQNVSKLLTLSSVVCRQSFFDKVIEFPLLNVLFDLSVPDLCVKLDKPSTKSGKFGRGKSFNVSFDILNFAQKNLRSGTLAEFTTAG
jgi:hypothetical protein